MQKENSATENNFKIKSKNINDSIYVNLGFWVFPKTDYDDVDGYFLKRNIGSSINKIFSFIKKETEKLDNIDTKSSIFISNLPDNFFYNGKRNFINIEIYFFVKQKDQKNSGLLLKIVKDCFLNSGLIQEKEKFNIFKNSK